MRLSERTSPESRRLTYALLLSLLIHASLLLLKFGGQGLGLPAFGFPWQDRRVDATDLRVALVPAPVTVAEPIAPIAEPAVASIVEPAVRPIAEPPQQAAAEQPLARGRTLAPPVSRAPATVRLQPADVSEPNPKPEASPETDASPKTEAAPTTDANPTMEANPAKAAAATAEALPRSRPSRNKAPPPSPAPAVIALEHTDEETWVVPASPAIPPIVAPALSALSPETTMPSPPAAANAAAPPIEPAPSAKVIEARKLNISKQDTQRQAEQLEGAVQEAARQAAGLQEATRQLAARKEAARQEAARRETERQDVARQAAALQEASRQLAAQQEAALQEAARQAAALQEAARQEAAQQEAARVEAARVEAARVEATRVEAARVEAERAEPARKEAARLETQEAEARREARLRAIGRQLDEEAAQRDAIAAVRPSSSLPPPAWAPARRYRLFGRTDPNEDIIRYAEAWERKIELNMTFDMIREALKQPHTDPMVTVAIRSDGSVEKVTFVQSSGVPALDEAIRRIIDILKPYQAFPPSLAREYDVLEIRRTWQFDMAIRLY